jgi:hypothetical protein
MHLKKVVIIINPHIWKYYQMQVNKTDTRQLPGNRIIPSPQKQNGFASPFAVELARAKKNNPVSKTKETLPEKRSIKLGTISSEMPTVSHLLVRHPQYAEICWEIVHSRENHDKPYTRIPSGTPIYLDPDTKKISWEGDDPCNPNDTRTGNPPAASCDGDIGYPENTGKQLDHETLAIEMSISRAAADYDLPHDLIRGVIKAESNFNITAVSRAGAQGLMQLMPDTARELGVRNPFDIRENIDAGSRYLKQMINLFGGDIKKGLAAYNAGPGTMRRFNGEVPYRETRQYVERVLSFLD